MEEGGDLVELPGGARDREAKAERTVGNDNCVAHRGRKLQIPPQRHRCHYVRDKVSVHEYEDGGVEVFHGTLRLGRYDAKGRLLDRAKAAAEAKSGQITCS